MGRHSLLAFVDGEPVGLLRMMFWDIEGSRDIAVCNLEVRPAHRRRGIGTALLRVGLDHCVEQQKPTVIGTGILSDEIRGFWGDRLGLTCGLVERESQLVLADVDPEMMRRWIEQRHERAGDYLLEHVRGSFPPELRDAVAALNTAMNDAPYDDLDVDDEVWTAADVEAEDEFRRVRGEQRWTTIAFAPTGEPAGLTAVILIDDDETFGVQNNTVVLDAHRERGIGRWLKADMWQRLRADRPALQTLLVDNAASNDVMLAINDAMGFRETARYADWQGEAATMRARLGSST
jgi:GNAT superfamily N-acetyltransferase